MKYFNDFLFESVYGNYATVYHRTTVEDFVNKFYDGGFRFRLSSILGGGFYGTYDLKSQNNPMLQDYGNIVVKFALPIDDFLILDYDIYMNSPMFRKIKDSDESSFIISQLKYFGIVDDNKVINSKSLREYSTKYLGQEIIRNYPQIVNACNGIIYTDRDLGKCVVCYKPNELLTPLSYRMDGESEFQKIDTNSRNFKNLIKRKISLNNSSSILDELQRNFEIYPIDSKISINVDGSIDVDGSVTVFNLRRLEHFKSIPVRFNKIAGTFFVKGANIQNTDGFPKYIGGDFILKDCPKLKEFTNSIDYIGGYVNVIRTKITTLEWMPSKVGGNIFLNRNRLKSLRGCSQGSGTLDVSDNDLTNLKGCPSNLIELDCRNNKITTLKDLDVTSMKILHCQHNRIKDFGDLQSKIESLIGVNDQLN